SVLTPSRPNSAGSPSALAGKRVPSSVSSGPPILPGASHSKVGSPLKQGHLAADPAIPSKFTEPGKVSSIFTPPRRFAPPRPVATPAAQGRSGPQPGIQNTALSKPLATSAGGRATATATHPTTPTPAVRDTAPAWEAALVPEAEKLESLALDQEVEFVSPATRAPSPTSSIELMSPPEGRDAGVHRSPARKVPRGQADGIAHTISR
ncbi:hypothetical protein PTTG_10955, partial [Puccinia triticina 1-1 BBBD Race 1]|uniref:Uncharacterized protein n=1 Tax=Puccinia triticina (isolate 1-1 / race 1 (BBBD)) TaxID=630390 RepID=A0A0C4FCK1_PUCT1